MAAMLTSKPRKRMETDVLIQKYVTGELTAAEAQELFRRLREHSGVADDLLEHLRMHEMLRQLIRAERCCAANFAELSREQSLSSFVPASTRSWIGPLAWGVALAACLAVLVGGMLWWGRTGEQRREPTTRAVAVLTRAANAMWASEGERHFAGAALLPGWLRLQSGVIQVEFFNGARVVLEGPAEFQLVSAREAFCRMGRLTAEVPTSARGFQIRTPQMNVVDLGTAFGLNVRKDGAEVHVFRGAVELEEKSSQKVNLKEGEAVAVGQVGVLRHFPADRSTFVLAADLDRSVLAEEHLRHQTWLALTEQLRTDPDLVAHFGFEGLSASDRTLRNLALGPSAVGDAAIVGCAPVPGRWQTKGALEFYGVSSRVLLHVPGEFKSLTLAAWVRVDSLDNNYNSLFMSDGFVPGAAHWQILYKGQVRLGVARRPPHEVAEYDTPVIFTRERFGQWTHLAVVYDATAKRVTHYLNGEVVQRQPLVFEVSLRFGPTQLGNWNRGDYTSDAVPIRNFNGRMDEFEFFRRALTDAEVRGLYEAGAPRAQPAVQPVGLEATLPTS